MKTWTKTTSCVIAIASVSGAPTPMSSVCGCLMFPLPPPLPYLGSLLDLPCLVQLNITTRSAVMKYPFVGFSFVYPYDDADYEDLERCSACHRRERDNTSTMYLAGPVRGYNSNEVCRYLFERGLSPVFCFLSCRLFGDLFPDFTLVSGWDVVQWSWAGVERRRLTAHLVFVVCGWALWCR